MQKQIKNIVKEIINFRTRSIIRNVVHAKRQSSWYELITHFRFYYDAHPDQLSSLGIYRKLFSNSDVLACNDYLYPFDPTKVRIIGEGFTKLVSVTPDYSLILQSKLIDMKKTLLDKGGKSTFEDSLLQLIEALKSKANQMAEKKYPELIYEQRAKNLVELLDRDCLSLDEAIQKLLFYNGLLWQVNHGHNGLGRLDLVLAPYYQKDLLQGKLTYNDAKIKLKNMVLILGKQTRDKSAMLIGDTGQYILLGGIGKEGENIDNDLTQMFLEIFEEIRVPDPKLIIRVNEKTTDKIWHSSMKCLFNGCGSPLLMNETLIMNKMVSFGYAKEDVWNFGTSACWEPLVIGKSSDQNNPFQGINLCDAIQLAMECGETYSDYDAFLKRVVSYIEQLAIKVIKDLNIDYSPLMSLFLQDCWNNRLDFAHKGSKYMYQGAQVVGLPNLVNSLLNIKEFVFEKKVLSLEELNKVLSDDYIGHDDIRQLFLNKSNENFGKSSEEILNLSNNLIAVVGRALDNVKSNDSKVKYGLSSPGYMYASKNKKATPDGRKFGMPYAVHISPVSSDIGVSEVLDFATHLDYPVNCLNGNVVDFIIPVAYQKHLEKLTALVKNSFQNGLFQLQLNVLDKATLIDAKAHPEKYPNLVVRVWGFSAYFNDLPEEFKNNLIARAEMYESA